VSESQQGEDRIVQRASALSTAACAALLAAHAAAQPPAPGEVEKGRYLARVGDCVSCHTAPGGKPYAGGRAIDTGFGTLYTPNITPDPQTGIGGWSADDFYRAMHAGRDEHGRHLYPAFPYPWFTKVTRSDVDAIKAYLDTLEPVRQPNKAPELSWWLSWRPLMAGWNLINFDPGEFKPDPNRSAEWNRGAYLVEGLGHCGDCHTAKKTFGGPLQSQPLQGGVWQGWYAPDLSGDRREGLGRWSAADIVEYLKTGSTARTASAGRMSEVIAHSTRYFSDADLASVATYLKSLPATPSDDTPVALGGAALRRGEGLFEDHCAACHMHDGSGIPNLYPSLKGNPILQARDPMTVIKIVLGGARMVSTPEKPTGAAMPAFDWKLDDAQIADVANYVRNAWGNRAPLTDASAVAALRKTVASRTAAR
jgi:mono/diheme cytochrome c family protein